MYRSYVIWQFILSSLHQENVCCFPDHLSPSGGSHFEEVIGSEVIENQAHTQ